MAMTIEGKPYTPTPAYNTVKYYVDSDNKNSLSYRYIAQVYDGATLLFTAKVPPRPNDGYGEFDLTKSIQNYLDKSNPFDTSNTATGAFLDATIKFGEQLRESWSFTSIESNDGLMCFVGTNPTPYEEGDQIQAEITFPPGDYRDAMQGFFTVVSIIDTDTVQINLTTIGADSALIGKVYYADGRTTIYEDEVNTDTFFFNAALAIRDYQEYDGTKYQIYPGLLAGDGYFLTSTEDNFRVMPDADMVIHYYSGGDWYLKIVNSNGDEFSKQMDNTLVKFNIGGGNMEDSLTVDSGSLPVVKDTTEWYDFTIVNEDLDTDYSRTMRLKVDTRCPIEDYSLLFMDRKGSWIPFAMMLRSESKGKVTRRQYNHKYGELNETSDHWEFETTDQGVTNFNVEATEQLLLRSNYLSTNENKVFTEMVTSPYVYVKIDGVYFACTITDTSYTTLKQSNKRLIKRDVTIQVSLQDPINI